MANVAIFFFSYCIRKGWEEGGKGKRESRKEIYESVLSSMSFVDIQEVCISLADIS